MIPQTLKWARLSGCVSQSTPLAVGWYWWTTSAYERQLAHDVRGPFRWEWQARWAGRLALALWTWRAQ